MSSVVASGAAAEAGDTAPALEGEGLVKAYDGRTVVDVEHVAVAVGEVYALLGPNGAGKSTLFRMLALLERPDGGRIRHFGRETRVRDRQARRRIAAVFQRPVFFAGTVRDNVAYGLRLRHEHGSGAQERVVSALEMLGMEDFLESDVRTLSGGELQRVALARAFVLDPQLLFLDEPTSNLDPSARRQLREELRDIVRRLDMTVVLITHDQNEAFNLADRVGVVRAGRIVQEGVPDQVFRQPTDSFVAEFMGLETIWDGRVERVEEGLCLVRTDAGVLAEVVGEAHPGERVKLTMRPEDVTLAVPSSDGPRSSVRNRWRGQVEALSLAGPLVRVRLRLRDVAAGVDPRDALLVALVTRPSAEALGLAPDVEIEAQVKATALHLLAGSGR